MSTVRLTVAQALVRFLASQYTERDGVRAAAVRRLLRHLRPRQRGRRRPGAARGRADRRRGPAVLPGPQRAGDGARGRRLRPDAEPAADLRLHHLDRPRLDQHGHRRRARDDQPPPGAAAARRHLRHPGRQPGAAGARGPALATTSRVNDAFRPVSRFFDRINRPEQLPVGAARRDAGAHRPGRDRRGDAGAAAGRAGRGVRLAGRSSSPSGSGTCARPVPEPAALAPRRRRAPRRRSAADRRRRRRHLLPRPTEALRALRRGDRHPGRRHPGRQGRAALGPPAAPSAASAPPARRSPTRWPARPTSCIGIGTRYSDFTTASRTAFAAPGRAVRQPQRRRVRRRQARGRRAGRRRPGRRWRR